MVTDERIIKVDVVRYEYLSMKQMVNVCRHVLKRRRVLYHLIRNSCERADINRYIHPGIHQRTESLRYLFTIMDTNGHFGNAVRTGMPPRGFNIDNGVHFSNLAISYLVIRDWLDYFPKKMPWFNTRARYTLRRPNL